MVFIDTSSVSGHHNYFSYEGLIYFAWNTCVFSIIESPGTSIESCSVYYINVKFMTYKPYDTGSSIFIAP